MTDPVVGVVCALRSEARHLSRRLPLDARLESLSDGALLSVTGMGLSAAAAGAERLVTAGAGALLSWGMAGGLDPQLRAGRLFLPSEIAAPGGEVLPSDVRWRTQLAVSLTALDPLSCGRLLTAAATVGTVAAKAALWRSAGALAVDMESSAVADVGRCHGLPFIAVRVIIDDAATELPAAVAAATGKDGQVSAWRVFAQLLRQPAQFGALVHLARAYAEANRTLAAVARTGALGPRATARASPQGPTAGAS